jgi:hypothetical protein
MKSILVKVVLAISIASMVALAVVGAYVVADQSKDPAIVAPAQNNNFSRLPNQAPPKPKRNKPFVRPGFFNDDAPGAR